MKLLHILSLSLLCHSLIAQPTFTAHFDQNFDLNNHEVLESADLDGDGKDELILQSQSARLRYIQFSDLDNYTINEIGEIDVTADIQIVDFDGDGDQDVLHASVFTNFIKLFLNDGTGTFSELLVGEDLVDIPSVVALDVEGDGDLDVLASVRNGIQLFRNDDNSFTETSFYSSPPSGTHDNLTIVDWNEDGINDIVAISDNGIYALILDANGNYMELQLSDYDDGNQLWISDFDNDGMMDLLTYEEFSRALILHTNEGNSFSQNTLEGNAEAFTEFYTVEDLDQDGLPDIVSMRNYFDSFEGITDWSRNLGNSFDNQTISEEYNSHDGVVTGDFDGDGDQDIASIAAEFVTDGLLVFENELMTNTEEIARTTMRVYPNPAFRFIVVEVFDDQQPIQIFNVAGQLLHQQQSSRGKQKIDVSRFTEEVLLVKIGDSSQAIRLTK
ncbi:MAG TPA: T9SS type A sorting domain-containing protein [Saprospiraceae bacterium]|nr:T9SS type A sorting domain-containing protein [Saprospiraceae bacterium]